MNDLLSPGGVMENLPIVYGGIAGLSLVAALFFARMWRRANDRFYLFFAIAFTALTVHWCLLSGHANEHSPFPYFTRLASFVVIIAAIVDKNRRAARS
jgi:hypothetical protein